MKLGELVRRVAFKRGQYDVEVVHGGLVHRLLELHFDGDDEPQTRRLARVRPVAVDAVPRLRGAVANALVRAGARHPGLQDRDLAALHAAARREGYVELFVDINVLTQGLVAQIIRSLSSRVARVVVSSSTIDVLHEYQGLARHHHDGTASIIEAWELARGLRALRELKAPVHVHQLAPGAARYFRRGRADAGSEAKNAPTSEHREEVTYIAEDRQMVAAFWDYVATDGPRLPLFLVTADLALAHVCAAERVPFVFARAPRERVPAYDVSTLWFDPYSCSFRICLPHSIIWELAVVLGTINVRAVGDPQGREEFGVRYNPRDHLPGEPEDVAIGAVVTPTGSAEVATGRPTAVSKATRQTAPTERMLKLSLKSVVDVLPTSPEQKIDLSQFKPTDDDSRRQLQQIGDATELFTVEEKKIIARPALAALLAALKAADYIEVNKIFRRVPAYDRVLTDAMQTGAYPNSRTAGAATGWAIMLGAAYKLPDLVRHGLAEVTEEQFENSVVRAHTDAADGQRAVPMHKILDRVCSELSLSPVRFEVLLSRSLGQRGLRDFEAQRALSKVKSIPAHDVLTHPKTSAPSSYLRKIAPADGITVANKLVGSLVRRPGRL